MNLNCEIEGCEKKTDYVKHTLTLFDGKDEHGMVLCRSCTPKVWQHILLFTKRQVIKAGDNNKKYVRKVRRK